MYRSAAPWFGGMSMSRSNLLQRLASEFVALHETKEDLFWEMAQGVSERPEDVARDLAQAEKALNRFRRDPTILGLLSAARGAVTASADRGTIDSWMLFFEAYTMSDPNARRLADEIVERETALVQVCGGIKTGIADPSTGSWTPLGPNALLQMTNNHPQEAYRRAAYEGLLKIERFVLENGLLDIVRLRNKLARCLGYEDFYDLRTSRVERMRKRALFAVLDQLAAELTPRVRAEIKRLEGEGKERVRDPWNLTYYTQGSVTGLLDAYYPLSDAMGRWVRGFAGMGIRFGGAQIALDLLERPGKFPNGYMHVPGIPLMREGRWSAARANILTHGNPGAPGTGVHVTKTLSTTRADTRRICAASAPTCRVSPPSIRPRARVISRRSPCSARRSRRMRRGAPATRSTATATPCPRRRFSRLCERKSARCRCVSWGCSPSPWASARSTRRRMSG